jgi:K+ transporter
MSLILISVVFTLVYIPRAHGHVPRYEIVYTSHHASILFISEVVAILLELLLRHVFLVIVDCFVESDGTFSMCLELMGAGGH